MLGLDQRAEPRERDEEENRILVDDGVRGPGGVVDEGHLAEESGGFQHREGLLSVGALLGNAHRPLDHQVEAVPWLPFPEEDLAGR